MVVMRRCPRNHSLCPIFGPLETERRSSARLVPLFLAHIRSIQIASLHPLVIHLTFSTYSITLLRSPSMHMHSDHHILNEANEYNEYEMVLTRLW